MILIGQHYNIHNHKNKLYGNNKLDAIIKTIFIYDIQIIL